MALDSLPLPLSLLVHHLLCACAHLAHRSFSELIGSPHLLPVLMGRLTLDRPQLGSALQTLPFVDDLTPDACWVDF